MSAATDLLLDAARRPVGTADQVLEGLDPEAAHTQPGGAQNTIVWLIWHAARQQDAQITQLAGGEQVWTRGDWASHLGVDRGERDFGFGDTAEQVAELRVRELSQLRAYLFAVVERTGDYVRGLSDEDLTEVIDSSWDPPVTRGVRLVSVVDDATQHLGQAAYARTLVESGWSIGY